MYLNLRNKIILISAAILFLGIGANTLVSSIVFTREYTDVLKSEAFVIGNTLKSQLDRLIKLNIPVKSLVGFDEQCKELITKHKDISYAMVVDPTGRMLFQNDPVFYGSLIADSNISSGIKSRKDAVHIYSKDGNKFYDFIIPVYGTHNEHVASVRIGFPVKLVSEKNRELVAYSVGIAFAFLCFGAILLVVLLNFWVTTPLGKFIAVLQDIRQKGAGFASIVEIDSRDEFGQLGSMFNNMTAELKESNEKIKTYTRELETSEERYRKLFDAASMAKMGIVVIQNDSERKGVLKYANQMIVDLSGYSREELLSMTIKDIIAPDNYDYVWQLYTQNPLRSKLDAAYQIWGIDKKGAKIPLEISPGITEFEGKTALVCYVKDITEKLKTEKKLEEYRQNLETMVEQRTTELQKTLSDLRDTQSQLIQSEKMASIGQLAAGVAHEINNPVGFVKSNLGAIDKYWKDVKKLIDCYQSLETVIGTKNVVNVNAVLHNVLEDIDKTKQEIDLPFIVDDYENVINESREGMKRIIKIVSDLKDFAHPGEGKLKYAQINENIDSTLNVIWNELKYKATVTKDYGKLPEVECYPQQLNQVFMNILVNAAQSIEEKGEIDISTRAFDENIEIKISDTGSGIPEENLTKIFDPFFTTKDIGKGTGLGLNVAYNIIESHNGTIEVESETGKGTTFTIRIPVEQSDRYDILTI